MCWWDLFWEILSGSVQILTPSLLSENSFHCLLTVIPKIVNPRPCVHRLLEEHGAHMLVNFRAHKNSQVVRSIEIVKHIAVHGRLKVHDDGTLGVGIILQPLELAIIVQFESQAPLCVTKMPGFAEHGGCPNSRTVQGTYG